MDNEALEQAIEEYSAAITIAKSNQVATWEVKFLKECVNWCIFIETEMSVLTEEQKESIIERVKRRNQQKHVATAEQLLDALHHLFYLLLNNTHLSNQVYLFIIKNYHFLRNPDQQALRKDLTELSRQSATSHILSAMLEELNHD